MKTNALVDTVSLYRPGQLDTLRIKYPDQHELLARGQVLGKAKSNSAAMVELAIYALEIARERIDFNLLYLRKRLRFAKKLRLITNVVSALSSAGLLGAVLGDKSSFIIVTALINFFSTVGLLIAQYLESPLFSEDSSPQKLFDQLVHIIPKVTDVEFKLKVSIESKATNAETESLVQQANALVASVRSIEAFIGTEKKLRK